MEEELKCPVCGRLFSNPVLLTCGHALCLVCARKTKTASGNQLQTNIACGGGGGGGGVVDPPEGHDDNPEQTGGGGGIGGGSGGVILTDHDGLEVDATSIASETDSGVVCRSRPDSYLGTPCGSSGGGGGGGVDGNPPRGPSRHVVVCVVCRRVTCLDDRRGPEGLPVSRILESLAERFRESKRVPVLCQLCPGDQGGEEEEEAEAREAKVFCEDCNVFCCDDCFVGGHPGKTTPPHKTRNLIDSSSSASSSFSRLLDTPKCAEHEAETLELYCCSCKTLLCSSCSGRHEGHAVQSTHAVCKTQKCELSQLLHSLSDKVRSSTELIHRLRLMQDHIQVNHQDFETGIAAQCDALIEALQKRKEQLLLGVAHERTRKEVLFKERISSSAVRVQKTTGLLQFSIEVLRESDPTAFLQMSTSLIDRVTDVYCSFSRGLDLDQSLSSDVELCLDDAAAVTEAIESLALQPVKEPKAPFIVTESCRSENNTVTVVWSPAHDGSSATGYVLELDDGSKGNFREVYCGSQTICMVEGLLFGRQYMARVKAFNKAGISQCSQCVCLQTSYVAWFAFDPVSSHPDVLFSNDNQTVTSRSFDDRLVLGGVGLSSGVHYWELTVDRFDNNKDPAFGVALAEHIATDKMLGKCSDGWSMYIDSTRSWFMHDGRHFDRTEGGIAAGSTVGVLLDLDRQNLSFYVNGDPHGGVINTGRHGRTFHPAISLNRNVQVTLTSGLEVPVDTDNEEEDD